MHFSSNVLIFGESGVGKSSVVNLIAGKKVAETTPDAWGCISESKQYTFQVQVARGTFNIWDTIGLGGSFLSTSVYLGAIEKAYSLIQRITTNGKLNLLLFCIPGSRITSTMVYNYRLFFEVLCEKRVPIALVVTRLEDETRMDNWWNRNESYLNHCGLYFSGHACVTGLPGHEKAREGRAALEHLLLDYDREGRYRMPQGMPLPSPWHLAFLRWLASIIPRQKEVKDKRKQLERVLRVRCMMDPADARRLTESLIAVAHE